MTVTPGTADDYDPGDLGRRLIERRQEVGLTRDEVAQRAGVDPGYLKHVEEQASARPSLAACARLAVVLDTSVEWLRGGGIDRPPGADGLPPGVAVLEVLDRSECFRRLRPGGVGRVVFTEERGPVALPVNYRLLDDDVVFRTGEGTIGVAAEAGAPMSIEVDHLDEALGEGWSVLITGTASVVTDKDELRRVEDAHVDPWAGGDRHRVVRISTGEVSGRRIRRHAADGA